MSIFCRLAQGIGMRMLVTTAVSRASEDDGCELGGKNQQSILILRSSFGEMAFSAVILFQSYLGRYLLSISCLHTALFWQQTSKGIFDCGFLILH